MIHIDGSTGEGGGQLLRSSLGLSIKTGEPFTIKNIRAGRARPGLMRQHLTAVTAAAQISNATVTGDRIGSSELTFMPGKITPGNYRFAVGTAGSTSLVLQTVLPPLLTTSSPTNITLEGGTHNAFAPPFDFLQESFAPMIRRAGISLTLELRAPGFYPAGGGAVLARIIPGADLKGFSLLERGGLIEKKAVAQFAHINPALAKETLALVQQALGWPEDCMHMHQHAKSLGPGFVLTIHLKYEYVTEVITGFAGTNIAPAKVAQEALDQVNAYLATSAPVGEHLTDQLMLPLALAGSGEFRCIGLSGHAQTHIGLIGMFLKVPIKTVETSDGVIVSVC
jgi:RNA 3'-terminal phosphate cyclase (ATP)